MLILATALALLSQTPAPTGSDQVYHSVILDKDEKAADKKMAEKAEHLKIASFRWGPRQATSADGSTPPQDSVIVKLEHPWASCQVGAAFPSLVLIGGGKQHVVEQVTVSNCGGSAGTPEEGVTFVYDKLTVSSLDPQKK